MMVGNKKDSTIINQFYSKWAIVSGLFSIKDFAFATAENRIAVEGWIRMNSDSLDMTIPLVDTLGCSIISQDLIGSIDHPKPGKVRIITTALAPVTNLADKTLNIQCDVFYDGVVKPIASHKKDME
jgi:hypothetical protein